ncbi:hypothetical protein TNCT_239521 [Trichonephila clavata]|uniref:Uncharacterized protein n=1 Tax=Trichonephila clavata TaxID=2740835 RepID=A0A8X6FX58_TRICU|nr:hypothetical protein TNCT_239521 [Trichonephila clavata]
MDGCFLMPSFPRTRTLLQYSPLPYPITSKYSKLNYYAKSHSLFPEEVSFATAKSYSLSSPSTLSRKLSSFLRACIYFFPPTWRSFGQLPGSAPIVRKQLPKQVVFGAS